MPNYSYKVRVLAAIDAHGTRPVHLLTLEARVRSDCSQNHINLPSTWRKWTKTTLDKLVEDGWLVDGGHTSYASTPALRKLIADEKNRLGVPTDNHELKTYVAISRKMPSKTAPTAPPSPPPRKRRSLAVAVEVPSFSSEVEEDDADSDAIVVRPTKKTRARYSDPGPSVRATLGGVRNQRHLSNAATAESSPSQSQSKSRRSSGVVSRRSSTAAASAQNRRHTLPARINSTTRQAIPPPLPSPVSKEMQFIPLRQALTARSKRALRRYALSDEMNSIDAEKRVGLRRNREELIRLRNELAESGRKLEDLERQLQATRCAPPSETGSVGMAPIYEEQEDNDDTFSQGFGSSSAPRTPFRFNHGNLPLTPALRRLQTEGLREPGETPITRRDKKINDLESQIETLRRDIQQREEEERRRAEEEDMFHDAEEQLFTDMSQAEFTFEPPVTSTPKGGSQARSVSFVAESEDDRQSINFGAHGGFDDENDDENMIGSTTPVSSAFVPQSTQTELDDDVEMDVSIDETITIEKTTITRTNFEQENETLKASIDVLKGRVTELEETLAEAQYRPDMRASGIQTDATVDAEKEEMKRLIEKLEDQYEILEHQSTEERHNMWQKVKGYLSTSAMDSIQGVEDLDMAIEEILTNLTLAESMANERAKACEKAERDLSVERIRRDEKEVELEVLTRKLESLTEEVEELKESKEVLQEQTEVMESKEEKLQWELDDLNAELSQAKERVDVLEENLLEAKVRADEGHRELIEIMALFDEERNESEDSEASDDEESPILGKVTKFVEILRSQKETLKETVEELRSSLESEEEISEELKGNLADWKAKLDDAEEKAVELQDALTSKDQDIDSMEQQLGTLKGQYEDVQKTNEMLNGVIAAKNDHIQSLNKHIEKLNTEITSLNDLQESANTKIDELNDLIAEKEDFIAELQRLHAEELAERDEQIELLTSQLSTLNSDYENANDKIDQLNTQLTDKDEHIVVLEQSHTAAIYGKDNAIENLEQEVSSLQDRVTFINGENELANHKIDELSSVVADKERTLSELNGKYAEDIAAKDKDIKTLEEELDSVKKELIEYGADYITVNKEKEEVEARIDALLDEVKRKDEAIAKMNKLNDVIAEKNEVITGLNGEVSKLNESIVEKDEIVNGLNGVVLVKDQTIAELNNDIVSLNSQLASLNEDLFSLDEAHKTAQDRIQELEEEVKRKERTIEELEKLKDVIVANNETIQSLNDQLSSLSSQLSALNAKYDSAEDRIDDLSEEVSRKAATINQLEAELDQTSLRETEANKKYNDALLANESLKEQLDEATMTVDELRTTIEEKEVAIEELMAKLDDKDALIDELKTSVDDRDGTIEEQDEEISNLRQQVSSLEESIKQHIAAHEKAVENLRIELTKEKSEAVHAMEIKLQKAIQSRADLETELFRTCAEYKKKIEALEVKVANLEQDVLDAKEETDDVRDSMVEMEELKNEVIEKLETKVEEITAAKEEAEKHFSADIERRRVALAELEKEIALLEIDAEKEKHIMRLELEQKVEEIANLRRDISDLKDDLKASHDEEDRLEEELKERETDFQLMTEEADKARVILEESKENLAKEIDLLRLELSQTQEAMRREMNLHVSSMEEKESNIADLNEQINIISEENTSLRERIDTLLIDNTKWEQSYHRAVDDGLAALADLENNYMSVAKTLMANANNAMKVASMAGDKRSKYLQSSKSRIIVEPDEKHRQHITYHHEGQEGEHHDEDEDEETEAESQGGLMSPDDATTNVSTIFSPPTPTSAAGLSQQHGTTYRSQTTTLKRKHEKRKVDSGYVEDIDGEEEEEELQRMEYGAQRRAFIAS